MPSLHAKLLKPQHHRSVRYNIGLIHKYLYNERCKYTDQNRKYQRKSCLEQIGKPQDFFQSLLIFGSVIIADKRLPASSCFPVSAIKYVSTIISLSSAMRNKSKRFDQSSMSLGYGVLRSPLPNPNKRIQYALMNALHFLLRKIILRNTHITFYNLSVRCC